CRFVGCRPEALREIAGEVTGTDLKPFFSRWVTGKERPRVTIGFAPTDDGADLRLEKSAERPMTLELWLEVDGGGRGRRPVALGGRSTLIHVETTRPVLGVSANPRHEMLVDVRSAVAGDVDFDGESDGFDVLRCVRQL